MTLRKDILGLDEVHMYDVYAPLVKGIDKTYSYEEAKELVIKALEPLGEVYISDLKKLFDSNCIDVYNNENKRGGAYSWGCYDTLPYVLLNFVGKFTDVSTIAHELGHSMHSLYSHKYQDYHDSGYPIFLAEIASTVNEIFLNRYCCLNAETKEEKAYYLNNLLENFRTTLIRQTMFAEFELLIHDLEEKGESSLVAKNPDLPVVDLYKAGHHGSKTSSSKKLLEKIKPQMCAVCCCAGSSEYTKNNDNQFPTQQFINNIAPYTDKIYVTTICKDYDKGLFESLNGNIIVSCSKGDEGINVNCSNNITLLKDTEWFLSMRKMPDSWKN